MTKKPLIALLLGLGLATPAIPARAQDAATTATATTEAKSADAKDFAAAASSIQTRLQRSLDELAALRKREAEEKLPLSKTLAEREAELERVRQQYQDKARLLDSRTLDLTNLQTEIKSRREEATYISNLLGEYTRNMESRLHIAELQRYQKQIDETKLTADNSSLGPQQIFAAQAGLVDAAFGRIEGLLGGEKFKGRAVDPDGDVRTGTFVLVGPVALFRASDGKLVGTVEQRLGSLEPTVVPFDNPEVVQTSAAIFDGASGTLPLDPTLGNAHKIEETHETLIEHIKKGGPVMIPIFILAGAALLVAVLKWLAMTLTPITSQRRINALLAAVARGDKKEARQLAGRMRGPIGRMLAAGAENLARPRELVEEVMFEQVLAAKLKLQRFLPFIAISASSAPLLGLLGTVTGIIQTFKLITVFGTGDVKTLSSGISEALITTEFGLYVAIPSLLLHALLSRKAQGTVNKMEKAAVALVNQIGKPPLDGPHAAAAPEPEPGDDDGDEEIRTPAPRFEPGQATT